MDLLCILLLLADFLESVVDQVAHREELQEVVKEDVVDNKHKLVDPPTEVQIQQGGG